MTDEKFLPDAAIQRHSHSQRLIGNAFISIHIHAHVVYFGPG